jgi:hypothetical protein
VPFWSPTFSVTEERSVELDAEALLLPVAVPAVGDDEDDDEQPAAASPARVIVRAA